VNYIKHDGDKKYFRKFFKFQVMNPFSIKPQTHELQHGIFLSAQIQNMSPVPLFVESIRFEPIPLYSVVDLNTEEALRSNFGGDMVYLKGNDSRQYLFRLETKHDSRAKAGSVVGKIDVFWKSNLGEAGRMQSVPVERKISNQIDLDLTVKKIPSQIILEQPFAIQCELINTSDRTINPRLTFLKAKMNGIIVNGLSGQTICSLQAGGTMALTLNLFPIKPGVQKITGIRVIDNQTAKTYDFNDFLDVFVETK